MFRLQLGTAIVALAACIWCGPSLAEVATFDPSAGVVVGDDWVEAGAHWYAVSPIDGSHSVDVSGGAFNLTAGSRLYFSSDTPYGHLFSFDVHSESPSEVAWSNPLAIGPVKGIAYPSLAGTFTADLTGDFSNGYYHQGELFWFNFSNADVSIDNIVFDAIPEPATWALMIAGFGLIGSTLRRRPQVQSTPASARLRP